jgi:hypothetical protein
MSSTYDAILFADNEARILFDDASEFQRKCMTDAKIARQDLLRPAWIELTVAATGHLKKKLSESFLHWVKPRQYTLPGPISPPGCQSLLGQALVFILQVNQVRSLTSMNSKLSDRF